MRVKIIMLVAALLGIVVLALFGFNIKEKAISAVSKDIQEYNCEGNLCTSCYIEGNLCSCGEDKCDCGNKSFDKRECKL